MKREDAAAEPELTPRTIVFGLLVGSLLAAGNVYAGSKLGIVDSGMTIVVLLSFAFFAAMRRPLSRREANVTQVSGSSAATMALTAGVIGPVPALTMGGHAPSPVWVALWGAALAVFGTLLALPFRRQLIEEDALPFPSGTAAGELINGLAADSGSGRGQVRVLFLALGAGALVIVLREEWQLVPAMVALPIMVGGLPGATLGIGLALSPLVLGVGLLVGVRVGVSILLGAGLAWGVFTPHLHGLGIVKAEDFGSVISWLLWPGAALMVTASIASLAMRAGPLWRAWAKRRADRSAAKSGWVRAGVVVSAAAIVAVGWAGFGVNPLIGLFALVVAVIFSIVGLRATGETDQTPSGPLGGLSQVMVGATTPGSTVSTLFSGGVTNGASAQSATMMQAWKAGHIVGSSPARLLTAQLLGVGVGAVVAVIAYALLDAAYGIGSETLPSPSAVSWKATADVVQGGISTMPPGAPLAALVAALVAIALAVLERVSGRAAQLLPSAVAVGIGFVLPFYISAAMALGAFLMAAARRVDRDWFDQHGAPLAAGLITGEALAALVFAALMVAGAR